MTKTVTDDKFGERTFYGIRVYLESSDVLHHGPDDDDRSAITYWVPWTKADGHDFEFVQRILRDMLAAAYKAENDDGELT